jgi:cytochrome c-type biogenesis protein CcmH
MILFWVLCAGLIVIALAFVLPPLLEQSPKEKEISDIDRKEANIAVYRDQLEELKADLNNGIISQHQLDQDTEDIERRLLEDTSADKTKATPKGVKSRRTAYTLAMAIPLIAVVFYLKVGSPEGISGAPVSRPGPASARMGSGERSAEQIAANVDKLAEKLKSNPSDVDGWIMLARSYTSMQRFGEAAGAYARATELRPNDADLWADYAFATAMAGNRTLKLDPNNAKALQLAGTAAFDAKDYKKAIQLWQRVLSKAPAGSDLAQAISERIDEARRLSGTK